MIVFLNGRFVPEENAVISVFDRAFLYGDGLFEGVRVFNGKLFRWTQHFDRLQRGADFLSIKIPQDVESLRGFADELIAQNKLPDSLLRLTLSRGVGPRGYSPKGADQPTLVMSLHPLSGAPARCDLVTSSVRLPANVALAHFKTCNKLPQILARAEADAVEAHEALLLNTDGFVVEASSSNLFWIEGNAVCTPPLSSGILPGVTRAVVVELCRSLKVETRERAVTAESLKAVPGVFVTLSSWGVVAAASLDGHALKPSALTDKIRQAYGELMRAETA